MEDGTIIIKAILGKSGVVDCGCTNGKTTHELRHPDFMFSKKTLDSLKGAPLVINPSPPYDNTDKMKSIGHILDDVKQDGYFIRASIKVTDKDHHHDFSVEKDNIMASGYCCVVKKEKGEFQGVKYDHVLEDIKYTCVFKPPNGKVFGFEKIKNA